MSSRPGFSWSGFLLGRGPCRGLLSAIAPAGLGTVPTVAVWTSAKHTDVLADALRRLGRREIGQTPPHLIVGDAGTWREEATCPRPASWDAQPGDALCPTRGISEPCPPAGKALEVLRLAAGSPGNVLREKQRNTGPWTRDGFRDQRKIDR